MLDYLQLKETFGLDLETEVVSEVQEEIPVGQQHPVKQEELHFG